MSSYKNFIQDFPNRAFEILDKNFKEEKASDREVTLLISIAFASIIVPFERLRQNNYQHPGSDRNRFQEAKESFDKICKAKFLSSPLWDKSEGWEFTDGINLEEINGKEVADWASPELRQKLSNQKDVNEILSHLRNSLSHGSIFTYPNYTRGKERPEIETIIFLNKDKESQVIVCDKCGEPTKEYKSQPTGKFKLLAVSPENFLKFLKNWISFIKSLNLE